MNCAVLDWVPMLVTLVVGVVLGATGGMAWAGSQEAGYWRERDRW